MAKGRLAPASQSLSPSVSCPTRHPSLARTRWRVGRIYLTSVASCRTGGKMLQSQAGSVTRRRRLLVGICCITNVLRQRGWLVEVPAAAGPWACRGGSFGAGCEDSGPGQPGGAAREPSQQPMGCLAYFPHEPLQLLCSFPSRLEVRKPKHLRGRGQELLLTHMGTVSQDCPKQTGLRGRPCSGRGCSARAWP